MSNADTLIKEILAKYDEDFASNTWPVPGGKARAIMHKCIERMAAKAGITFDLPMFIRDEPENVVMVVKGHMGDRTEWSVGECSHKNNKNAYPFSMAEKRGKDRVALKLIGLHGLLYSEEEAEDFKQPSPKLSNPAVPATLLGALNAARSEVELSKWYEDNNGTIADLPSSEQESVRNAYRGKLQSLRQQGMRQ